MNLETTGLTGKASVDKPWLKYYPEELRDLKVPKMTVEAFLKMKNPDENKYAFEYFDIGKSCALAYILFAIILVLALVQKKFTKN